MLIKTTIKLSILLLIVSIFNGCTSMKNEVSVKTNSAMISVDESTHTIKTGYEGTKHTVKKSYSKVSDSIDSLTSGFYENSFVQLFVSDGNNFSNRKKQEVNVKIKNIKLTGTKTIKSQKKDAIWFIAVNK